MVSIPTPNETVFLYPFEGRPKRPTRLGAFVLSPDTYMKLFGVTPQSAFAEKGLEPIYRRLKRALDGETGPSAAARAVMDLLSALEPKPFLQDFRAALDGDVEAMARADNLSLFDAMFFGEAEGNRELYGAHHWFLILLERMSVFAASRLHAGDAASVAHRLAGHPLLKHLIWPEAISMLETSSSMRAADPLMASMLFEASLATIAAWDVRLNHLHGTTQSYCQALIPSAGLPGRNPTSLFYDELQRRLGAHSIGEIVNSPQNLVAGVEQWTLNRWSAGTHNPDYETVQALLAAYSLANSKEVLFAQFWCSKQLNLIGHLCQALRAKLASIPDEHHSSLWPWPRYPFGYATFEEWAAARYPHWRSVIAEHVEQLPSLVANAVPTSDGA